MHKIKMLEMLRDGDVTLKVITQNEVQQENYVPSFLQYQQE